MRRCTAPCVTGNYSRGILPSKTGPSVLPGTNSIVLPAKCWSSPRCRAKRPVRSRITPPKVRRILDELHRVERTPVAVSGAICRTRAQLSGAVTRRRPNETPGRTNLNAATSVAGPNAQGRRRIGPFPTFSTPEPDAPLRQRLFSLLSRQLSSEKLKLHSFSRGISARF